MDVVANLININNNISNIYNCVSDMAAIVANLSNKPNFSNTNANPEDVMERKIYYGPNRP